MFDLISYEALAQDAIGKLDNLFYKNPHWDKALEQIDQILVENSARLFRMDACNFHFMGEKANVDLEEIEPIPGKREDLGKSICALLRAKGYSFDAKFKRALGNQSGEEYWFLEQITFYHGGGKDDE